MNDYLPDDELRDKNTPKPPSFNRVAIWVSVAAVGAYFVISGVMGMLSR
ncbi:hypothetical protein [Herbiconiux sp. L3-i23]|nr:hypothetical protein [Herbiconiux sp. L3-i23]BDI23963.1 hypothetical protein L3i23_27390 [Herbiconiux sp. L3-i23]